MMNKLNTIKFGNSPALPAATPKQNPVQQSVSAVPQVQIQPQDKKITKEEILSSKALVMGLGAATLIGLITTAVCTKKLGSVKDELSETVKLANQHADENKNLQQKITNLEKEHKEHSLSLAEVILGNMKSIGELDKTIEGMKKDSRTLKKGMTEVFDSLIEKKTNITEEEILKFFQDEKAPKDVKLALLENKRIKDGNPSDGQKNLNVNFLLRKLINSDDAEIRKKSIDAFVTTAEECDFKQLNTFLKDDNIRFFNKFEIVKLYNTKFSKERFDADIIPIINDLDDSVAFKFLEVFEKHNDEKYLPILKGIKPSESASEVYVSYVNKIIKKIEANIEKPANL